MDMLSARAIDRSVERASGDEIRSVKVQVKVHEFFGIAPAVQTPQLLLDISQVKLDGGVSMDVMLCFLSPCCHEMSSMSYLSPEVIGKRTVITPEFLNYVDTRPDNSPQSDRRPVYYCTSCRSILSFQEAKVGGFDTATSITWKDDEWPESVHPVTARRELLAVWLGVTQEDPLGLQLFLQELDLQLDECVESSEKLLQRVNA